MRKSVAGWLLLGASAFLTSASLFEDEARAAEETRGWLGVDLRPLGDGEAKELGFDREHGLMIVEVAPGSPAAQAELKAGDVLVRLGRRPCSDVANLREVLADTRPGSRIGFAAWREGKMFEGQIVLGTNPGAREREEAPEAEARFRAVQAERREVTNRREKVEQAIRETRAALDKACTDGWETRARELTGKLVDLCREAGRLEAQSELLARNAAELESRVARESRGGDSEREAATNRIEVMRLARKALAELGNKRGTQALERRVQAIEMALAGRRDAEAQEIMRAAPGDGDVAELLMQAAEFYRSHDAPDRADICARMGAEFRERARREPSERRSDRAEPERQDVERLRREIQELRGHLDRLERELDSLRN